MTIATLTRTLRAARYSRVSHDKTGEIRSVVQQERANVAAIRENGWTESIAYSDGERSASRFASKSRDQWAALLADLAAGKFDILVLWESSRGDRKAWQWLHMLETCREMDVQIYVTSDERLYDVSRPGDWKSLAGQGVDAQVESDKISKRVLRGMNDAATEGKPHGATPYGMIRIYSAVTKKFVDQVEDPATIEIVREIIGRIAKGHAISVITDDLNARGIPSPKGGQWIRTGVKWVARNRALIGQVANPARKGNPMAPEYLPAAWKPVVDVELFYAANNLLALRTTRATVSRPGSQKYLLSYLAQCSVCGAQLTARPTRGVQGASYNCSAPETHVGVKRTWLDEMVVDRTFARLLSQRGNVAMLDENTAAAESFETVGRLRADVAALLAAVEDESVDVEIGTIRIRKLRADIAAAEEAAQATIPAGVRTLTGSDDIRAAWADMSVSEQREVLRAVWSRITVDPAPVGSPRGGARTGVEPGRVHCEPA